MEKAGEGVSGHGGRGGEGLGDGVLGLIWSGFLLSGSRYILYFCLRSFFFVCIAAGFCIFGVGDFWCLYISVFILRVFVLHFRPSFLVSLMFYYGFKIMYSTDWWDTKNFGQGSCTITIRFSYEYEQKKFTSYILCILRLSFGPKHVLDNCWKI